MPLARLHATQDTSEGEHKKYSTAEKLHLPSVFHNHEVPDRVL
jgi:hypothetical protein